MHVTLHCSEREYAAFFEVLNEGCAVLVGEREAKAATRVLTALLKGEVIPDNEDRLARMTAPPGPNEGR